MPLPYLSYQPIYFRENYLEWQSELHNHVVEDVPLLLHVQRTPQVVHQLPGLLLLPFIVKLFFTPDDSPFIWKLLKNPTYQETFYIYFQTKGAQFLIVLHSDF